MTDKMNNERTKKYIIFGFILALGILLRFFQLGTLPGGLQRDEATVAMNSYTLFHNGTDFVGNANPFYMTDWGDGHSNMYVWLTQIPLLFSGGKLSNFVSRFPQAFVSVLTLVAVYGIGKETFGTKFGLWSMFLTAICPWHIMMSRWGLDANLAPGFMIISLYFFLRAQKREWYLIIAGIFYGLTLYTYAVTWVVVPITLTCEAVYMLLYKKLKIDKVSISAIVALFIVSLPPILFVLVNNGFLDDIRTPFFSIVQMNGYRGDEVSSANVWMNLKQAYHLFVYQDGAGEIWEIRKPWGLFYDLGRVFIVFGGIIMLIKSIKSLFKREFSWEMVFILQVVAASACCVITFPHLHRINVLYIPLLFCGAYGIVVLVEYLGNKKRIIGKCATGFISVTFLIYLVLFWKDYTGEYRTLVEAYWGIGMDQCVETALDACEDYDIKMVTVEKAAQWPKLMIYTETTSDVFVKNVVYERYPQPWSFTTKDGILVQTRIDYEAISEDSVYIIYFTDKELFEDKFDLIAINDWYVAIPAGRIK